MSAVALKKLEDKKKLQEQQAEISKQLLNEKQKEMNEKAKVGFLINKSNITTVEAAYMGRLGTGYCLLYPLSLIPVVQLTGPGRPEDRNMRAN